MSIYRYPYIFRYIYLSVYYIYMYTCLYTYIYIYIDNITYIDTIQTLYCALNVALTSVIRIGAARE